MKDRKIERMRAEFESVVRAVTKNSGDTADIMEAFDIQMEGILGRALGTAALAGSLAFAGNPEDRPEISPSDSVPEMVEKTISGIIADIEYTNVAVPQTKAFINAKDLYKEMKLSDSRKADAFARGLNQKLHKQLGIDGTLIGDQIASTSANSDSGMSE